MDVMQAILDIENKAQNIIKKVDEQKELQNKKVEKEIDELNKAYYEKARQEVEKIAKAFEDEQNTEIKQIEFETEDKKKVLNNMFSENKNRWVEEITKAIING